MNFILYFSKSKIVSRASVYLRADEVFNIVLLQSKSFSIKKLYLGVGDELSGSLHRRK